MFGEDIFLTLKYSEGVTDSLFNLITKYPLKHEHLFKNPS